MIKSLILFTAFTLIGCAQGLITGSTTSKGAKLSQYKTYAWTTPPDPDANTRQDDKFYAKLIENTANEELHKKGMKLNSQHPDAVFVFHTQVESQTRYSDTLNLVSHLVLVVRNIMMAMKGSCTVDK